MSEGTFYLDNAATTPVSNAVYQAMLPCLEEKYGNPSSPHTLGRQARKAVEHARAQVATSIHAKQEEIHFTSGGSESDNWAIKGAAFANSNKGKHIIASVIEHHAILRSCEWLEQLGFSVTYLPVNSFGMVNPSDVEHAIHDDTILISIMTANNEIGTIQRISEIGEIARSHSVLFHTDAVQAIGAIDVSVEQMHVDMLSISGHKFHAPKGVGALYVRNGARIDSLIHGGMQENGRRAGTENVAGIVGLGQAIELATRNLSKKSEKVARVRNSFWDEIREAIPTVRLNGHPTERLPGNLSIMIPGVDAESLLLALDRSGIAVSAGSACMSGWNEPSHVLKAIGLSDEEARCTIRLSFGSDEREEDIRLIAKTLGKEVQKMRQL